MESKEADHFDNSSSTVGKKVVNVIISDGIRLSMHQSLISLSLSNENTGGRFQELFTEDKVLCHKLATNSNVMRGET